MSDPEGSEQGVTAAGPRARKKPCRHDSTRVDGWLDDHCLRCGAAGYYKDGRYVDPTEKRTKAHPGGATLVWPVSQPSEGEERRL